MSKEVKSLSDTTVTRKRTLTYTKFNDCSRLVFSTKQTFVDGFVIFFEKKRKELDDLSKLKTGGSEQEIKSSSKATVTSSS